MDKAATRTKKRAGAAAAGPADCHPRLGTLFLAFCAVVVMLMTVLVWRYQQAQATAPAATSEDITVEQYQHMLGRAHDLIKRYKQLRGNASVPENLAFKFPYAARIESSSSKNSAGLPKSEEEEEEAAVVQTYPLQSSPRDAVMGMAMNTDPKNLAVFLKSLRRVSTCDIVLFINTPMDRITQQLVSTNNVKLFKFDVTELPTHLQRYHPSTLRWFLFRTYTKGHPNMRMLYNRIWMADVRDTYFQSDPFLFVNPNAPSFHVFQGVEAFPIQACGWNSGWVKDCFSASVLNRIGANPIICSGVSVGTTELVLNYIDLMASIVSGAQTDTNVPAHRFPACERNGVDQGVHNVLVHLGIIPHMTRWDQRSGPVANMQAKVGTVAADRSVVNAKSERYAVVHQYDRFPDLQRTLFGEFVDWVNTNDLSAEWAATPQCKGYQYKEGRDMFKGRCDLTGHGGATSAVSCCEHCNKATNCQAFTFLTGMCFLKSCGGGSSGTEGQPLIGSVSGWKQN